MIIDKLIAIRADITACIELVQLGSEPSNPYDFSAEDWTPLELDAWIIANSTLTDATILLPNVPRSYYSSTAFTTLDGNNTVTYAGSTLADTDAILEWYADNSITNETIDLSDYDARTSASDADKATIIANFNDLSVNDPAPAFPISDSDILFLYENYANNTLATDKVNSYNGTIYNNPSLVSGKVGNALQMSSGSSQYIDVPYTGNPSTFSISLWVYIPTGTDRVRLYYNPTGNFSINFSTGSFRIYVECGTFNYGTTSEMVFDAWNHVVVTLSAGSLKIYQNNNTPTSATITLGSYSAQDKFIGRRDTEYNTSTIGQFLMTTTELSAQNVSDLYNSGNGIAHD